MVLLFQGCIFRVQVFFRGYICQWPTAEEWIVNRFPQGKKTTGEWPLHFFQKPRAKSRLRYIVKYRNNRDEFIMMDSRYKDLQVEMLKIHVESLIFSSLRDFSSLAFWMIMMIRMELLTYSGHRNLLSQNSQLQKIQEGFLSKMTSFHPSLVVKHVLSQRFHHFSRSNWIATWAVINSWSLVLRRQRQSCGRFVVLVRTLRCMWWKIKFQIPTPSMYGIFTFIHVANIYAKRGQIYHTWIYGKCQL